MFFLYNSKNRKSGFTLIEILIAVLVFSIGVIGIYSLLNNVISTAYMSYDRFVASRLAQEGLEMVINHRDWNWLQGDKEWNDDLEGGVYFGKYDEPDIKKLTQESDSFLYLDNQGFYSHNNEANGVITKYKRKIFIEPLVSNPDNAINVKVEISWGEEGSPLIVEQNLYNWK